MIRHPSLSHVAFLVVDAEKSAATLVGMGHLSGPIESWPKQGTKEIYFGDHNLRGRLLLMEPIGDGGYKRAMSSRGPGLHHIGIDVSDFEIFIDGLSGSGWYLHPKSLATIRKTKTAWLARQGTPFLIEAQQTETIQTGKEPPLFISKLEVPVNSSKSQLLPSLGIVDIVQSTDNQTWLTIVNKRFSAASLTGIA